MDNERRREVRIPVQMFVEESHDHGTYFQHSSNLSRGGMFLEHTVPHPVGTRVSLQFTLPGDDAPLEVRAEIVSALGDHHLGMGLKFLDPPPEVQARIDRFIAGHGPSHEPK